MKTELPTVDILEESFTRRTESRRAVLEAIVASTGHFSAEELYKSIPYVGRATVYRTLSSLQNLGLICRVLVNGNAPRYRVGLINHHHHIVCIECGGIQDINGCGIDDFVKLVAAKFGYEPQGHRVEIYGRCPSCS